MFSLSGGLVSETNVISKGRGLDQNALVGRLDVAGRSIGVGRPKVQSVLADATALPQQPAE